MKKYLEYKDEKSHKFGKISEENPKPLKYDIQFVNGACFYFQFKNGEYGGVVVIADDLYETEGYFKFALTAIREVQKPAISDFLNTTFDDCKWYDSKEGKDYKTPLIDSYVIRYTSKKERLMFFEGLEKFFTFVGTIKPFERGFNSSYMSVDYFPEQETFAEALSNEMEFSQSQERKQIHLDAYNEELKPDTVKLKDFYLFIN